MIPITTQEQLLAALAVNANAQLEINASVELNLTIRVGNPFLRLLGKTILRLICEGSSAPHIVSRESSAPHIESRGSSAPHIESWGSSAPHIVSWGSSAPHIESRESSAPHIEASGFVQMQLRGARIIAKATAKVAVLLFGGAKADGGQQTEVTVKTGAEWCDYYGVPIVDGVAILYKALNEDFRSPRGTSYAPGTTPNAPDWDGGKVECGGGLHFSPSPRFALDFHGAATKFAGCPVAVDAIAVHFDDGQYPSKVKAQGCCGPCFEVDRDGVRV